MEKKSLVSNSIYNVIYKVFSVLFPLLTTAYISRVLLPSGVGRVTYANTVVSYFIILASLGIPTYGVKVIAQCKEKELRSKKFVELFILNAIATIICTIGYYYFINAFKYFEERQDIFNVMGIMLIFNVINIDWFYQGVEEYKYISLRSMFIKIFSFVLMLLFVKNENDVLTYAVILCMAMVGNYIFNVYNARKYLRIKHCKVELKEHIKPILLLLAAAVATEIYTMLDTVMLEYFYGEEYVAYYANSVRIVRMLHTTAIATVAAFYPRISSYLKNQEYAKSNELLYQGTRILLLISIPCAVGIGLISDRSVLCLFGKNFLPAASSLRILSCLIVVFSFAYFLGHIVLLSIGKEQLIFRSTVMGAVTNFVLNFVLIPRYQHDGAAIASVVAETIVTGLLLWESRKVISFSLSKNFIISGIASLGGMIISICCFNLLLPLNWIGCFFIVVIAVIVYFGILVCLRNELIMPLVEKTLSWLKVKLGHAKK